ncbi:MAG: hypothetical protein ACREVQ_06365, partial [Burkholderiales bacterium]
MKRPLYWALGAFSALDHWLRERLTPAGWIALGAAGAAGAAGLDTSQNASYQAATLLGALLLIAYGASFTFRARVEAHRELPRYATAGEPFAYSVVLANRSKRALKGATLRERLRDPRPRYDEWRRAREPGEEKRNWFDRNMGYFRWRWLIDRRSPQARPEAEVPALAPGAGRAVRLT